MRKHLYLITEHPDNEQVGRVELRDRRHELVEKNEEGVVETFNTGTGERREFWCVGLGYYDFEDEDQYEEAVGDVCREKLSEVDAKWHEKAGVEPEVSA